MPAQHGLFATEGWVAEAFGSAEPRFGRGMGVFFEKGAKLAGIDLWMHVGGHPEEVEGVVRGGIGAGDIFVGVRVAAGVVARVPVARLGSGSLGAGGGEIRVEYESTGATLKSGASFDVAQVLDLTLDLILRGLH